MTDAAGRRVACWHAGEPMPLEIEDRHQASRHPAVEVPMSELRFDDVTVRYGEQRPPSTGSA